MQINVQAHEILEFITYASSMHTQVMDVNEA